MLLFGKSELVFKTVGGCERWKAARKALRSAGIRNMEAGSYEQKMPTCGCGAKVDQRFLGPYAGLDRRTYYVSVRPADADRARELLLAAVGAPLESDEQVYPAPKEVGRFRKELEGLLDRCFG